MTFMNNQPMNAESRLRGTLLTYLRKYRKKSSIKMPNLISDLIHILTDGKNVTKRQLLALKNYLLREREFITFDADDLLNFFKPILKTNTNAKSKDHKSDTKPSPSLSHFFSD